MHASFGLGAHCLTALSSLSFCRFSHGMRGVSLLAVLLVLPTTSAYCNAMSRMGYGPRTSKAFPPGWNGLAKTPPRGWRSWYAYFTGGMLTQNTMEQVIDALVAKNRTVKGWDGPVSLCDLGYCSAGIDEVRARCLFSVHQLCHAS